MREQWKYWRSLSRKAILSALASDLSKAKPITLTNSTILAVGASGTFAGLVSPELVKRGAKVRGLIRDARQGAEVRKYGAAERDKSGLKQPS